MKCSAGNFELKRRNTSCEKTRFHSTEENLNGRKELVEEVRYWWNSGGLAANSTNA